MNILETKNLTKRFGGLIAVNKVNFGLKKGERRGIIGPNGAGKTTFFNLLSGYYRPSEGKIFFQGEDITNLKPFQRSRIGISRTFQLTNVFFDMTVFENVWVGANSRAKHPLKFFSSAKKATEIAEKAKEICEMLGLGDKLHELAGNLSGGDQRLLEVAIGLSTDPVVLLLDEPTSGLSPKESVDLIKTLSALPKELSIVLIEHNIDAVFDFSRTITVLHEGSIIAEGPPEKIRKNKKVKQVYLGE
jgi:branched-chain amino acid transport system ATP-binding protein